MEWALEMVILKYPILAKHNPYYAGSFNGNDCQQLLENVDLIFECLTEVVNAEDNVEADIQGILQLLGDHQMIWESFADVVPLLWSMQKLSTQEYSDLLMYIEHFASTYNKTSKENVIIKMHRLFVHL